MPIIGNVGRRSAMIRFLNISIHAVLILGAITMVYPFLIMVSSSIKSPVDSRTLTAIPSYIYDDEVLFKKWIETKYNESTMTYGYCNRERLFSFENITFPKQPVAARYDDWNAFVEETDGQFNEFHRNLGHAYSEGVTPKFTRKFIRELKAKPGVDGSIDKLNVKFGSSFPQWDVIKVSDVRLLQRDFSGQFSPFGRRMIEFAMKQPSEDLNYFSLDAYFVEQTLRPKYAGGIRQMNETLGTNFRSWPEVTLSRHVPNDPLREHWIFFVKNRLNLQFITVSDVALPTYREFLKNLYKDIALLNKRYKTSYESFDQVPLLKEVPRFGPPFADWDRFVTTIVKPEHLRIKSVEFRYRNFLKAKHGAINALIEAHKLGLLSIDALALTEKFPVGNITHEEDWTEFVSQVAEREWVSPDSGASRAWSAFLTKPYRQDEALNVKRLNQDLGTAYDSDEDVYLSPQRPANEKIAERWQTFVNEICPKNLLVVDAAKATPKWITFLQSKYNDVSVLNKAYGWLPTNFEVVAMPTEDVDYFNFMKNKNAAFWEFFLRNYIVVFEMMLYNGRAISNTAIYCGLAILAALLINPLAAYALSRYKPPSQYKLLLLLMLTMAFPPMVLGIPTFLLLRNFNLLNTFAALILPGAANGYLIFLLKGFFDSLPRELYESAQIDGASEWTMFWRITMATSKPILAVVALQAFTLAYGNFMLAFIVCQNPKMWTMMVHIYQLQQRSNMGVSFASLVIAAVPTFLVFVFCQNIIMRGIVVPTEK